MSDGASYHVPPVDTRWQRRLLPLMTKMLVGLTVFFFLASFGQLLYLQRKIDREASIALSDGALTVPQTSTSLTDQLAVARFRASAELEVQVISRRYRQATVLLMSRVWTLYLGFVTGMTLALVGAAFILGKLQEPSSELGLESSGARWTLKSASPGIVLAVLGCALMLATIFTNHRIEVTDSPLYLRDVPPVPEREVRPLPPLESPFTQPREPNP